MRLVSVVVATLAVVLAAVDPAFAQGSTGVLLEPQGFAALGIGIAAFGGAIGQSIAIAAALQSIGRNPGAAGQMFLPWMLALVLIESLVIYAFVISLKLVGLI